MKADVEIPEDPAFHVADVARPCELHLVRSLEGGIGLLIMVKGYRRTVDKNGVIKLTPTHPRGGVITTLPIRIARGLLVRECDDELEVVPE